MKSNFKSNLLAGFSISLAILIISSAASFISISNLLQSAELVNHTHSVILEVEAINASMIDAETGQRGYLLSGEEQFLVPYLDSRGRVMEAFGNTKLLTQDNPEQQSNLAELLILIDERFKYLDMNIQSKRNNTPIDPVSLRHGMDIMTKIRELIRVMETSERQLLAERTEVMNRFSAYTRPLIIAAALAALIITILFYVRVRRDYEERLRLQRELELKDQQISARIDIIRGIADQISQGNYVIRVNDSESDALGSVAGSLNKMAESLEYSFGQLSRKEWLQTGISGLNDVMIGEKDEKSLSEDVIEFLATYTQSNAGSIYVLENGELHAMAGFAYNPDSFRKKIKLSEGILGQCVVSGKPIQIEDVPAESMISFAAGEVRPAHVLAVPVFDGRTPRGAVELSSLRPFCEKDIEFLTSSAPNIGIAISTAQNRRKLQELLEETQSQAEELKTQHSELENLNSELEVQAEKLQASEEELRVQQEELRQANQELEERSRLLEERNQMISERNAEIQQKADQLTQSTRYKSEFLANMSHELRTPLNSILLLSRLMSENQEKNLTPEQAEYARVIHSSGNGLLSLIDEILDLSKIEAGKMQLDFQSMGLQQLLDNMKGMFEPLAHDKGIIFTATMSSDCPRHIVTDQLRLEQIVRNLLSNAVKFTAEGSVRLEISSLQSDPSRVQLIVKDTGIGIAKEKQSLVFEAFQQADGSTRRKYGGTGLGLSITRELTRLLGGEIKLTSAENEGSEFTVILPVRPDINPERNNDKKQVKALPADDHLSGKEKNPVPAESSKSAEDGQFVATKIPANVPDDRDSIGAGDKVILIVEDDIQFASAILEYTRKRGYKGVVAVRGDEGIALARALKPMGILLDIQLPVKSGWEVMENLKSDPQTRHIPVHIMSSFEVKKESLLKGAVDFINKPFAFEKMHDVFRKIEHVLSHHPKKVLIVEENSKHAKALAYFLETFDVNIEISTAVDDAISSLKNDSANCVILDMGIPDQKGYDTLEEVRRTTGLENIPIIIFTGKSLSQGEELRIRQYADSIVVKTAHSYKRILDEVSIFLHLMENGNNKNESTQKYHKLGALDEVLKGKTVLIADDDMRNIFALTKALEKYQMNVVAAVDGRDALNKLKTNPQVDIVLMDIMMPEMDGYESIRAIRSDHAYRNLPVIAVTAKAMTGDRVKCINAGASDYITKPVDVDQLCSLLRVWLYDMELK